MTVVMTQPVRHRVPKALRGLALAALLVGGAIWFAFFDSYSIRKRVTWHRENVQLNAENERLQQEITRLRAELAQPPTDELIEKIAREQYGMRRPGETVYHIEPSP